MQAPSTALPKAAFITRLLPVLLLSPALERRGERERKESLIFLWDQILSLLPLSFLGFNENMALPSLCGLSITSPGPGPLNRLVPQPFRKACKAACSSEHLSLTGLGSH